MILVLRVVLQQYETTECYGVGKCRAAKCNSAHGALWSVIGRNEVQLHVMEQCGMCWDEPPQRSHTFSAGLMKSALPVLSAEAAHMPQLMTVAGRPRRARSSPRASR